MLNYFVKLLNKDYYKQKKIEKEKWQSLFEKIDSTLKEKELFLLPDLDLDFIAREVATNRSYVSRAINFSHLSFKSYVQDLRLNYLSSYLQRYSNEEIIFLDLERIANICGFSSKRTLNSAILNKYGKTFIELADRSFWRNDNN